MGTAIVTGAGNGLGEEIALTLANEGYSVVVNDRQREDAETTVEEIRDLGESAEPAVMDVADEDAAEDLIGTAVSEYDGLDLLVNNAAIQSEISALDLSYEEWRRVLDVNLDAVFRLSQAAGRRFREQGDGGDIVNISSFHDTLPRTGKIHYDTAKAGVWMLTKDFALELAEYDVAVNCVAPGVMRTPMNADWLDDIDTVEKQRDRIPKGRLGEPEDVAEAVSFLVESDYITGARVPVDGGVSLVG